MITQTTLLIALYLASLILFCTVAQRLPILSPEAQHRVSALDGLRGVLATAVIVHHFTITYFWHTTGLWQTTDSRLINNLGAVPVSLFFMITGYLFIGKIRRGTPDWARLLSSRLRRIFPMYLFSVLLVVAISVYQSRDQLTPLSETLLGIGRWVIFVAAPVNGFADSAHVNASVQWTLLYEAMFYLSLPLLYCVLQRRVPVKALVIALAVMACLWLEYRHHFNARMIKLFFGGMAVALLEDGLRRKAWDYRSGRWTALVLVCVVAALLVKSYDIAQLLLLTIAFALFVLGNDVFGVLEHRGMKILGEASFSIYLLHGIVMYLMFSVWGLFDFERGSLLGFAGYLPVVIVLVSGLSVGTYWVIERPMMKAAL